MKILVVYDSVFGNTEKIAQAIGEALAPQGEVMTVRVSNLKLEQLSGLELLIVGSPTRGFRPTEGITKYLKRLAINGLKGVKVAAFDTRLAPIDIKSTILRVFVRIGGYAAKPIANQLMKCGGELVLPPEGFLVNTSEGPLKEGEFERAVAWAKQVWNLNNSNPA